MPESKKDTLPLQYIKGIGPQRAQALAKEGIQTPVDMLFYLPRTYVTHLLVPTLASLNITLRKQMQAFDENSVPNLSYQQEYTIIAQVVLHKEHVYRFNKKLLLLELSDGSGSKAYIRFWSYTEFYKKLYPEGSTIILNGKPQMDTFGKISFDHPDIQKFDFEDQTDYNAGAILPIYKLNEKLVKAHITTRILRKILQSVIETHLDTIKDYFSQKFREKYSLRELRDSIKHLHFPQKIEDVELSKHRLKFDEIFFYELNLALKNKVVLDEKKGLLIPPKSLLARTLLEQLDFELTGDQKKVIREIVADFESGKPMNRLLQGDVGSGKTIVALLTMLSIVEHGYQVAIMAPTEVLAEQHFHTISKLVEGLDIPVTTLTGGQKSSIRKESLQKIESGEAKIIIGTHALFATKINYHKLGYVIIDEQHKFGVVQRADLIANSSESLGNDLIPHVLVMSATPIPRTLSLTIYGELDVSIIKEMPKNRKQIVTKIASDSQLKQVFDFVKKKIDAGEQAYIVYPLVEKSEKMLLKSAIEHYELLSDEVFQGYKCGLLHGQLKWQEKEEVMKAFLDREYQILIATTVIEVGIDVPNASVMIIENSERFGLSQLHQLRGRVGRGTSQSYCILVSNDKLTYEIKGKPLKEDEKRAAVIRLKTMERTTDGFEIAEVDLKLRGPGDLLGTRQSGLPDFKYIDLITDGEIITQARKIAFDIALNPSTLTPIEREQIMTEFSKRYGAENFYRIA